MWKFIAGAVCGGLVMAIVAANHPTETKQAIRTGADKAATTVRDGVIAGSNVVDQQLADKGSTTPPSKPASK